MAFNEELALAKTFDKSPLAYGIIKIILDKQGKPCDSLFVYLNDALARIEGYSKKELLNQGFSKMFPNVDHKLFDYYYYAAYENRSFIFKQISEDMNSCLQIHCFPVEYGYCGCIIEDISEYISKEKELQNQVDVAREEIRHSNVFTNSLQKDLEMAEHANREKTIFLSNVSHDIRTPMNAITGFTNLATLNIDNKEKVIDYLEKIATSSNYLLSLVNDVLDMSRIESGKMHLTEESCNVNQQMQEIMNILQAEMEEKHLEFLVDTEGVVNENVISDRLRLSQIFINIIGNSVKYTNTYGHIGIRVVEKNHKDPQYGNYEFYCKDTGIGMQEDFLKHIFDPFEREITDANKDIQGTGLGMAITKHIIEIMGGTIQVKSEQNVGTEFIVKLPLKRLDGDMLV